MTAQAQVQAVVERAKRIVPTRPQHGPLLYEFAGDLDDAADAYDELLQGVLTRGAMSLWFGDSNSGKTFVLVNLGLDISRGIKWMGRHTEPGLVVVLATESPASVRSRVKGYQIHFGVKVPNFVIVKSPIDLFASAADTNAVVALVRALETDLGVRCQLIIGDTLARLSAGANENSGEDMGVVIRNADRIRTECGAHFALIHHCGKDQTRGARGWSGLRAATDTEIEVSADTTVGLHALEVTKQRDLPGKGERIGFRLLPITLGVGKWGSPITTCVVLPAEAPAKTKPGKRPSEIAGAVEELLRHHGSGMRKGDIVKHFAERYERGPVYRELKKMHEAGRLNEAVGVYALRGTPQQEPNQ
jgi:hypothetical protein